MRRSGLALGAALAAAFAAAGCHDLPDLGICGNGVVEEANGEACDDGADGSDTCNARCELTCEPAQATPAYVPVGVDAAGAAQFCPGAEYRCGTDLICRAPSGVFEPLAPPLPFDVGGSPVLGDVDNDGLLDLVGTSATNIYVRFASTAGGALTDVVVQEAPSADAPCVIFDPDPRNPDPAASDVWFGVPTEGVALLRSIGERFAPEIELPIIVDPQANGQVQALVARDPDPRYGDVALAVQLTSTTSRIDITRARVASSVPGAPDPVPELSLLPCDAEAPGAWRTVAMQAGADRRSFVVISQRVGAGAWHLCRYTHAAGGWALAELDFTAAQPVPVEIMHGNLDGDACQELLLRAATAPVLSMLDAAGAGCALPAAPTPLELDAQPAPLLAAGQVLGAGPDELVFTSGLYRACGSPEECGLSAPGTFKLAASPTKVPWRSAALTDLNGDGVLDVVAARAGESDVDVVRGGATSANVHRANTAGSVSRVIAGDFDGDRIGDAALAEQGPMGQRVAVLFGRREGIAGPSLPMSGPLGDVVIERLGEFRWIPSTHGTDGIDDIIVLRVPGPGQPPAAGFIAGDAARIMTTPRYPPIVLPDQATLRGVTAGAFHNGPQEVLALADGQAAFLDVMSGWSSPVAVTGVLRHPAGALRDGAGPPRGVAAGMGATDVVVFSVHPTQLRTECQVAAAGRLRELRGVDVDGDGVDEVAALSGDGPTSAIQLFTAVGCRPLLAEELAGCIDVVNAGERLLAVCRDGTEEPRRGVFELRRSGDGFARTPAPIARVDGDGRFLTAGDFDGDGVLDVAVSVHRVDEVSVQLLRQCPAHDTRTCRPLR